MRSALVVTLGILLLPGLLLAQAQPAGTALPGGPQPAASQGMDPNHNLGTNQGLVAPAATTGNVSANPGLKQPDVSANQPSAVQHPIPADTAAAASGQVMTL